jgi:hypothetical protein
MRRLIAGTGLVLTLALAGCGGEAEDPGTEIPTAAPEPQVEAGEYQEEILSLDEGQRNAVFIRAIRDVDLEQTCQGVESSAYVGEHQGAPMWTARCSDGTDWAILLGPTGSAQVMTCQEAELAGLPSCATRPTA